MSENRLRELRKEKGLTLKELSQQLKDKGTPLSVSSLIKYERGERNPKLETWIKLADFFEVSVGYLEGVSSNTSKYYSEIFQGMTDKQIKESLSKQNLSATQMAKFLGVNITKLSNFQKREFLDYSKSMLGFLRDQVSNDGINIVGSVATLIDEINMLFSSYQMEEIDKATYNLNINKIVSKIDETTEELRN